MPPRVEVHRYGRCSHIMGRRVLMITRGRTERQDRRIITGRGQGRARGAPSARPARTSRDGPAASARRRGPVAFYEELARISARRGSRWTGAIGDWELRAASGFTRRANSVLPLGDPGTPLDEALAAVRRWYAARGLPARIQLATGRRHPGTAARELEARGWTREVTAELWTGALAPLADRRRPQSCCHAPRTAVARPLPAQGLGEVALKVRAVGPSCGSAVPARKVPRLRHRTMWWTDGGRFRGRGGRPGAAPAWPRHGRDGRTGRQALHEGPSAAWLQWRRTTRARVRCTETRFEAHHAYHHYREPRGSRGPDAGGRVVTGPGPVV